MGLYELFANFVGIPAQMPTDPVGIVCVVVFVMCCALMALDFFDMLRDFAFIFTKIW